MVFLFALASLVVGVGATWLVKKIAWQLKIVDQPDAERKYHGRTVPLLGGVAIFISFWLVVGYLVFFQPIFGIEILKGKLFATFVGSSVLLVVGILDDVYRLPAKTRLAIAALAILVAIFGGLQIDKITNPLGGVIQLSNAFLVADLVLFVWLLGMTYTLKTLDGLDGLATGVVLIGSLIIFVMTNTARFYQPNVGLLALVFAGSCLGFLLFNLPPASIFLGESGSLIVGFILGVLAVIAGSKVATAFLVLAIPALDLLRVIYWRWKRRESIFHGDRKHLFYALVDRGWSERQVVALYYTCATLLGLAALFLQSIGKVIALAMLFVVMLVVGLRLKPAPSRK